MHLFDKTRENTKSNAIQWERLQTIAPNVNMRQCSVAKSDTGVDTFCYRLSELFFAIHSQIASFKENYVHLNQFTVKNR